MNGILVYQLEGEETIPYHIIWASFALLYGLWPWPRKVTWTVFGLITVITGIPLVKHAQDAAIGWSECSEIVLMGVILALLVWHVNRQWAARDRLVAVQDEERRQAAQREIATRCGSHELRTRLTIARGFAQLIEDSSTDSDVRADAGIVVRELDKATRLATNLLTLFRAPLDPSPTLVDVDELIDMVARRWSVTADREWAAISSAGTIPVDPERLEAALDCLLENAIKFTETGDIITVTAAVEGRTFVVKVRDSGQGIPSADLGAVFDVFQTSSNAGDRAGSGLGLAIVRAVAEAKGGQVAVASTLGTGTCFTLTFPLPQAPTPKPTAVHGSTPVGVRTSTSNNSDPDESVGTHGESARQATDYPAFDEPTAVRHLPLPTPAPRGLTPQANRPTVRSS